METNMGNREVAIQLSGVKKQYKLGQIGGGTLQGDIQSWWARIRGKEDPNTKIGQDQRLVGQSFMALNGVDLTVYKGEALGIIGGNGAGKSTMLKLLSRVTAPTEGTIDIYGRIASMLEVGTGFNGEMTGRENIYMNGAILGMTKAEIDAKMEDIIEFSEVREFIDTPVKRYSSGMYVKLAFSVAAHLDSEIMIMDEVLAVGDMAFQKKCLDKMRDAANREGRTVLYVSHNMNTIRQLCDRCTVLKKGKIVYQGDVEKAISLYMGGDDIVENKINLKNIERSPEFRNGLATMTYLEIKADEKGLFSVGDCVEGAVEIETAEDIENVYMRIIIKTSEGIPVTMSTSDHSVTLKKGIANRLNFKLDSSTIAPGQYNLNFVLYQVDKFGCNVSLDGLHRIYSYRIQSILGFNKNMEWKSQYWGHVYSKELQVECINN